MAQTKTLTAAQSAVGPGEKHTFHPEESNRGFIASIGGVAAAVTATVLIEVSTDNVVWAERVRFNLSGTATLTVPVVNSDVDPNGPFPMVRSNVISITGGGFVTVSGTAARSGAGAA